MDGPALNFLNRFAECRGVIDRQAPEEQQWMQRHQQRQCERLSERNSVASALSAKAVGPADFQPPRPSS